MCNEHSKKALCNLPVVLLLVCIYNKLLGKSLNPPRSYSLDRCIIILAELIIWTNNEWWMARKRVYAQMATLSQVCIVIMFVMESHLKKLFSCLRRRPTLMEKIVHFSVSILVLDSERMVSLDLKHKILCSWFLSHHSYMTISVFLWWSLRLFMNIVF